MSNKEHTSIWIKWTKHGIHKYPNAPEEVAYLREPHRHLFYFKVQMTVFHDDREVEFHMLQNELMGLYDQGVLQLDYKSCEMLARDLLSVIRSRYGKLRRIVVEVSEDNECGAEIVSEGEVVEERSLG